MKFSGKIGFWEGDVETKPGVYKSFIVEKDYVGDVMRNSRMFQNVDSQQNDNLVTTNKISVVSNLYLMNNWHSIKYVFWNGVKWKVKSVDITSFPRAVLELGGVYNGQSSTS